jgi:hypothetical protein
MKRTIFFLLLSLILICNISCDEDDHYTTSIVGTWVKISPVENVVPPTHKFKKIK